MKDNIEEKNLVSHISIAFIKQLTREEKQLLTSKESGKLIFTTSFGDQSKITRIYLKTCYIKGIAAVYSLPTGTLPQIFKSSFFCFVQKSLQ